MIRKSIGLLVVLAMMVCMASVVFARGGPPGKKAFTSNAVVTEQVAPVANLVPVMTGYDVIENITTEQRDLFIAQNTFDGRYIGAAGLSPTGAWRSHYAMSTSQTSRSGTMLGKKR